MRSTTAFQSAILGSILVVCLAAESANAQNPLSVVRTWSSGTAYCMPAGRWEIGLFQPLRWGAGETLELSTHPLAFFLVPNLEVKWLHRSGRDFTISSRHSMYYPTPLLRTITRKGIGGIISPEFHIPHMVSVYNEVLVSRSVASSIVLTAKAGFCIAFKSGNLDERTTIDLPVVFPRLYVFYRGYGLRTGFNAFGKLFKRWTGSMDVDFFYYPGAEQKMAFEHQGRVVWCKNSRFKMFAGYQLSYGEYPFGTQWHLLAPLLDLQWGWNGRK